MDIWDTKRAARGEVYDPAERARSPSRGGVVGSYSSGELGTVDECRGVPGVWH